jgi:tripartite-type tricarboxylate transporter receptor subunit TctC
MAFERVTLVVPVGAGTITDATARLLAEYLKNYFAQPFLVENRPGAGATLGSRYVARSTADGYTSKDGVIGRQLVDS